VRRILVLGAALVVLVANGWGVWQGARNRNDARGGTLRLSERELPLQAVALESSVTVLRLNWRTDGSDTEPRRPPAWLDARKLAALGFDCRLPLDSPQAQRHYSATPARPVFLALEFQAGTSEATPVPGRPDTGLVVVDAAADPQELRARHPDPQRHVVCRGLVRMTFRTRSADGVRPGTPRLEAWVNDLRPAEISVSKPTNRLLTALRRTVSEEESRPLGEPRFSAQVRWGTHYEPWVDDVRALGP
jgi:hypothetical protein